MQRSRIEVRNNLTILDLTYLSNYPKALQDVNAKTVCLIETLKDTVNKTDNLQLHNGETRQLKVDTKYRQLPTRKKKRKAKF